MAEQSSFGITALVYTLRREAKRPRLLSSLTVPLLDDAADALDDLRATLARVEAEHPDSIRRHWKERALAAEARCRQLEDALRELREGQQRERDRAQAIIHHVLAGGRVGWAMLLKDGAPDLEAIAQVGLSSPLPAPPQEPER